MRIFLVRHGESQANVEKTLHKTLPDHEIALSSRGMEQPAAAAEKLSKYIDAAWDESQANVSTSSFFFPKLRIWNSPYRRTRDTAFRFCEALDDKYILDQREHVLLCEQQFGIFDGLEDNEIAERFPAEFHHWNLCKKHNGKFWARYPMGESPFDTSVRIHQSFGTFQRDEKHGIKDIAIICHGTVVKLFEMMWLHKSPEWFATRKTVGNCGIVLIENKTSKCLFGGFKHGKEIPSLEETSV